MADYTGFYAAFMAKDARFDGRFFAGIKTTGIYCRPICRAKRPKEKNCVFFKSAAEAEQAGFRPCLLCRPEQAPGTSITDAGARLAFHAAKMLEQSCGSGQSLFELAVRLGCTDRHLRRVFAAEFNVTPVRYLQTCRLLLAKQLLTDTGLSVLDIAMAAGFGSLRRFNDLFRKHYRLSPTALRKRLPEEFNRSNAITLSLGYRPPYLFDELLQFLAGRAIPGVEVARNGEYWRTVRLYDSAGRELRGWLRVGQRTKENALDVTVSETLLPVLPQVLSRVRYLFDLYCDPQSVSEKLSVMNDLRPGVFAAGTRLPGCFDAFEMSVRAILGQQITVKAATTITSRFAATFGTEIQTGIEGLTRLFPTARDIFTLEAPVENQLGPLGIIASRAKAIFALAGMLECGELDLGFGSEPEAGIKKLMQIPGIGSWTAKYITMRTTGWTDGFLETDAAVKKALAPLTAKEMLTLSESWRPWRSYAVMNIWNSLQ